MESETSCKRKKELPSDQESNPRPSFVKRRWTWYNLKT